MLAGQAEDAGRQCLLFINLQRDQVLKVKGTHHDVGRNFFLFVLAEPPLALLCLIFRFRIQFFLEPFDLRVEVRILGVYLRQLLFESLS